MSYKSVTSLTGNNITNSFDFNGDGVWDKVQAIVTTTVSGVKTETLTNKNGGNVLLDSRTTVTSADGKTEASVSDADVMMMARRKFERRNSRYGWRYYAMTTIVARAPEMAYRPLKLAGAR